MLKPPRTLLSILQAIVVASAAWASTTVRADYPDKPIHFVVPFAAGGGRPEHRQYCRAAEQGDDVTTPDAMARHGMTSPISPAPHCVKKKRPSESLSIVTPAIAAAAGGRAGTCMIAAPRLTVFVCPASHASTLTTSEP